MTKPAPFCQPTHKLLELFCYIEGNPPLQRGFIMYEYKPYNDHAKP
jgi:hypothetical protein